MSNKFNFTEDVDMKQTIVNRIDSILQCASKKDVFIADKGRYYRDELIRIRDDLKNDLLRIG